MELAVGENLSGLKKVATKPLNLQCQYKESEIHTRPVVAWVNKDRALQIKPLLGVKSIPGALTL